MFRTRTRVGAIIGLLVAGTSVGLPATGAAAPVVATPQARSTAAKVATGKIGSFYKAGAAGPKMFDCSGLVDFAFRAAGQPLGVRTSQDMAKLGAGIRRTAIRRGDLVFTWSREFGHVGIAIDAKRYVHAPAPGRRVVVAPIPAGAGLVAVRRP